MEEPNRPDFAPTIEAVETARSTTEDKGLEALLEASAALLIAADTPQSVGQCKEADPFAPIYLVFDSGGHRYECTHKPAHSTEL